MSLILVWVLFSEVRQESVAQPLPRCLFHFAGNFVVDKFEALRDAGRPYLPGLKRKNWLGPKFIPGYVREIGRPAWSPGVALPALDGWLTKKMPSNLEVGRLTRGPKQIPQTGGVPETQPPKVKIILLALLFFSFFEQIFAKKSLQNGSFWAAKMQKSDKTSKKVSSN